MMTNLTWWAKIEDDQVIDLIIVNGNLDGAEFTSHLEGEWIQSPEDGTWAIMGGFYDRAKKEFYAPKPHPSWTLNANLEWIPPTPRPNDGKKYAWYEAELSWMEVIG